ncbi:hypothetical protein OG566_01375 [Streptomyces sp. NBC_01353]|nr:hypothetical protein [Streptomyces sp. NBC_01353]
MTKREVRVWFAALLMAGSIVGCAGGSGDEPRAGGPPSEAAPRPEEIRDLTTGEEILVERAERILVKRCMEGSGFTYWLRPPVSAEERAGRGFVLDDIAWARTYGYGREFEQRGEKARLSDPNAAYANGLPEPDRIRYSKTLDGDPAQGMMSVRLPSGGTVQKPRTGCWNTAGEQLYGDIAAWFRTKKTATSLTPLYVPELLKDRRLTTAVAAWARCMKKAGHAYASPDDIRAKRHSLVEGMSPRRAHATEVELAVVEATCAVETSLGRTARALESEYRAKKLQPYSEDLATYQRTRLTALARAETITGSKA